MPAFRSLGQFVERLTASAEGFDLDRYKGSRGFDFSHQTELLHVSLQTAVLLWHLELEAQEKGLGPELFAEELYDRARRCGDYLAEYGDALMFLDKKRGRSAEAFNRLAEGIACLAFCPGGVTAFGTHWERQRTYQPKG